MIRDTSVQYEIAEFSSLTLREFHTMAEGFSILTIHKTGRLINLWQGPKILYSSFAGIL